MSRKRQLFALDDVVGILMNGTLPQHDNKSDEESPPPKRVSRSQPAAGPLKIDKNKFYATSQSCESDKYVARGVLPNAKGSENISPSSATSFQSPSTKKKKSSEASCRSPLPALNTPKASTWSSAFFKPSPGSKIKDTPDKKTQSSFSTWLKKTKDKPGDPVTQTILDAGQKEFGVVQCDECKMVYSLKSPDDELLHMKHHDSFKEALRFPNQLMTKLSPIRVTASGLHIYQASKDMTNLKSLVSKCDLALSVATVELERATDQPFPAKLTTRQKAYVCLDPGAMKIVGVCVVEPVPRGYPSQNLRWPLVLDRIPRKCIVGVRLLWIAPESRGKGIAKEIMECVRSTFIYGCVLAKRDFAVAPPTLEGFNFFKGYLCGVSRSSEDKDSIKAALAIYEP